jgi:hypothetical protein
MYGLVATKIDTKLGGNKEFGTGFLRGTNCGNVQIHHISTTNSRDNSLDTLYGGFRGLEHRRNLAVYPKSIKAIALELLRTMALWEVYPLACTKPLATSKPKNPFLPRGKEA